VPTGIQRIFASDNAGIGIDGSDDKRVDADVAVIDTGIDLDHPDLNVAGARTASRSATRGSGDDGTPRHACGGHHRRFLTTGSVSSALRPAHACTCASSATTALARHRRSSREWTATARASTIEVANMSLSGGASASIDAAAACRGAVAVAVVAGANDSNAANYSPGRAARCSPFRR
jgi:subtilisin family serine protease